MAANPLNLAGFTSYPQSEALAAQLRSGSIPEMPSLNDVEHDAPISLLGALNS